MKERREDTEIKGWENKEIKETTGWEFREKYSSHNFYIMTRA